MFLGLAKNDYDTFIQEPKTILEIQFIKEISLIFSVGA